MFEIPPKPVDSPPVIFRVPPTQRFVHWILRAFAMLFVPGVVALVIWIPVSLAIIGPGSPPTWFNVAGFVIVFLAFIMTAIISGRSMPSRLVLSADGFLIGGTLALQRYTYEDIRLVELNSPERTLGRMLLLIIRPHRGMAVKMWLAQLDAEECFHALRGLCDHAAAIGVQHEAYRPVSADHDQSGRAALAREFRRRGWMARVGSIVVFLVAAGAAIALAFSPGTRSHPRAWMSAMLLPFVAMALLRRSILLFRQAKEMLGDAG